MVDVIATGGVTIPIRGTYNESTDVVGGKHVWYSEDENNKMEYTWFAGGGRYYWVAFIIGNPTWQDYLEEEGGDTPVGTYFDGLVVEAVDPPAEDSVMVEVPYVF